MLLVAVVSCLLVGCWLVAGWSVAVVVAVVGADCVCWLLSIKPLLLTITAVTTSLVFSLVFSPLSLLSLVFSPLLLLTITEA